MYPGRGHLPTMPPGCRGRRLCLPGGSFNARSMLCFQRVDRGVDPYNRTLSRYLPHSCGSWPLFHFPTFHFPTFHFPLSTFHFPLSALPLRPVPEWRPKFPPPGYERWQNHLSARFFVLLPPRLKYCPYMYKKEKACICTKEKPF